MQEEARQSSYTKRFGDKQPEDAYLTTPIRYSVAVKARSVLTADGETNLVISKFEILQRDHHHRAPQMQPRLKQTMKITKPGPQSPYRADWIDCRGPTSSWCSVGMMLFRPLVAGTTPRRMSSFAFYRRPGRLRTFLIYISRITNRSKSGNTYCPAFPRYPPFISYHRESRGHRKYTARHWAIILLHQPSFDTPSEI